MTIDGIATGIVTVTVTLTVTATATAAAGGMHHEIADAVAAHLDTETTETEEILTDAVTVP